MKLDLKNKTGLRKSLGGVGIYAAGGIMSAGFGMFGFIQHALLHSKEGRSNFSELLADIGFLLIGAFLIGISVHRIAAALIYLSEQKTEK
jgi:uncharacterized membrane protein